MITEIKDKSIAFNCEMKRERILVDIPQSDLLFLKIFADKFGWQFNSKQSLWEEYIKSSTENVDMSEEEIVEIVTETRYGKVQNYH